MLQPGAPGPSQHPVLTLGLHLFLKLRDNIGSTDNRNQTFWHSRRALRASVSLAEEAGVSPAGSSEAGAQQLEGVVQDGEEPVLLIPLISLNSASLKCSESYPGGADLCPEELSPE